MTGVPRVDRVDPMSESPRREREQDLLREIVELVGGSRLSRREPDRPAASPAEPAAEPITQRVPPDEEKAS